MDVVAPLLWIWVCTYCVSCKQVNVALKKNASTTSGVYNGDAGGLSWDPSGAVDGDHVTLDSPSSCFHSATSPADWTVDLGQRYQLNDITVYIRTGLSELKRTAESIVYVDKDPSRVCYTFPSTISDNPTHLTCDETARYVTIRNPGNGGVGVDSLNICEVEIYACTVGYHGADCEVDCHCDECDRWTGICKSSCDPAWEGERCDRACNGTYGSNCTNSCDARHCGTSSSSCDPVNGTCDSGCTPGWMGHDCIIKCLNSTYGQNCSENCTNRHCLDNSTCDHVTGSCDQGCESGWTSSDCTEACSGTYGYNCINSCDARHCSNSSSSCDPVNGTCDSGCLAGWTGQDCFTVCPISTYGLNCSKNCTNSHCMENSTCDHVTGSCNLGCEPGWKSFDCTEVVPDATAAPESPMPHAETIPLYTTVGVLVIIIVILAVLLIRVKLKKRSSTDANKTSPDPIPITNITDITYSNADGSTTPSTYETLRPTDDNHYTGLKGRNLYENT